MYYRKQIMIFLVIFTILFTVLRSFDGGDFVAIQLQDLAGIPWLFSVIGLIFSILTAFIIQKQWENWQNLHDSILSEVSSVNRLWLMSESFPVQEKMTYQNLIKKYLNYVLDNEWRGNVLPALVEEGQNIIFEIGNSFRLSTNSYWTNEYMYDLVAQLYDSRNKRLSIMSHKLPIVLERLITFNTFMLIALSMFIGVKSLFLDYLFTFSVGILVYVVYLIIKDLGELTMPGFWQVKPTQFALLLTRFNLETK